MATPSKNIVELEEERAVLTAEKQSLESEVIRINAECATRQPEMKFKLISRTRAKLVSRISTINLRLTAIRNTRKELSGCSSPTEWTVRSIREVRDKYQAVAAGEFDEHGPSERMLAAQFVRDLNPIISRLCHL